jgi:hypothetical protein
MLFSFLSALYHYSFCNGSKPAEDALRVSPVRRFFAPAFAVAKQAALYCCIFPSLETVTDHDL